MASAQAENAGGGDDSLESVPWRCLPGLELGRSGGEYPREKRSLPCWAGGLCCLTTRKVENSTFLEKCSPHEVRSGLPWHRNTPGSLSQSILHLQVSLHSKCCSGSSLGTVPAPGVELPLSSHLQWEESFGLGLGLTLFKSWKSQDFVQAFLPV